MKEDPPEASGPWNQVEASLLVESVYHVLGCPRLIAAEVFCYNAD